MKGILADINIAGQVRILIERFYESEEWIDLWRSLELTIHFFANVGLDQSSPDDIVWQTCQDNKLILITGNRNYDGPTSLEATIRGRLQTNSLPVITVSKPRSLGVDPVYTADVGVKLLEYLLDMEFHRGTGRLYVP